eukprot:Seg8452.2 transcript_id=Seg8452.2/GoldUCD/mRNA.D3Y31 product="hypothetical protein" protein_id=Seg8452.2/GoldUCD/D3Y31
MRQDSANTSTSSISTSISSDKAALKELQDKVQNLEELLELKYKQLSNAKEETKFLSVNVLANPNMFKLYTGITPELVTALYESISPYTENLHFWIGPQNSSSEQETSMEKKLGKQDQFFFGSSNVS